MRYSYVTKFDDMPNMAALGLCLAAYIYNNADDYTSNTGVISALHDSTYDFIDPDPDIYYDFVMYTECMLYFNDKYGTSMDTIDEVMFKWYWTMVDSYAQKYNLDHALLFELAMTMDTMPDYSRANIDILLDLIGKKPTDFTLNFSDGVNNDSLSYLFIELCNLMSGRYTNKPLDWHEYSSTVRIGVTTAIEIAIDPLYPEWWFEREVEYRDLNPFPADQYVRNAITGNLEAQYRFMAEFMLIF